ncbi:MAG: ABC transporter ATP-binding protein [Paracoccus sp. (in: a-proteobacteria)]|uniref:ABC transporter ATP-binding protein n=1 Tax=Paracoccus sp. TaxID=267 RepID=UPI0026DEC3C8|nr:ABC transporter ATP-binding protein [Paracoccus sp. (in: a-proteobacteria)]MDO5612232.1 ABC transporter ATP-binding protein [Paracoccus sp. (in: a-proteobacteria)]
MPPPPQKEPPRSFTARWAALKNIPPFLVMVWRAAPHLTIATMVLRAIGAFVPVAILWIAKLILDEVVRLAALPDTPDGLAGWWHSGLADHLITLVALELGIGIASDIIGRLLRLVDSLLQERLVIDLSMRLMDHAAALDLEDFEDAGFQDKLERARRQAAGRMSLMGTIFEQLQDSLTIATLGAGLIVYNPWLILILLVGLIPAFLAEAHFNARSYNLDFRRTAERRETDYLRQTAASAETAKEIKIFDLHRFLSGRYLDLSRKFYAEARRIAQARAAWGALFSALGSLAYYAAYAWIVVQTLTGDLSIGDLTFLAGSFMRVKGIIERLLSSFGSTAAQALYLEDLFDFFREVPEIASRPDAIPVPRPIRQGFVFENVGFRYPNTEKWAVRGLSFTLHAGETLALVGENGAGKTTLVKLLARLYDPDEGRILLDGRDLRDYDLDDLRAAIGVIFQDFVRYAMTAADNIAVGRIEAREDRGRIEAAAHSALADQVIARLPAGYDQMVGKRFVQGVDLSGGEWQKLAIARAYMRDAQVLILDEPTAALDARSEFEVFQRFRELMAGRTAVLISHRFSSVRMADRILVLHLGRIEAQGTHVELLDQPGRYRELFELQAAGYR